MGLLDDAIRDHLELKRRRGADPGEVAREQKEALEPVLGTEDPLDYQDPSGAFEDQDPQVGSEATPVAAASDGAPDLTSQPAHGRDMVGDGEETAELDMRSVLKRHEDERHDHTILAEQDQRGSIDGHRGQAGREEVPLQREGPGNSSSQTS